MKPSGGVLTRDDKVGQAQRVYEPLAALPEIGDRTQVAACVHALVVCVSHIDILYQYDRFQQKTLS